MTHILAALGAVVVALAIITILIVFTQGGPHGYELKESRSHTITKSTQQPQGVTNVPSNRRR